MKVADIPDTLKFPEVEVELSGTDGNAFSILGKCQAAIRRAHGVEEAKDWVNAAQESESYDELLQFCMATLDIS